MAFTLNNGILSAVIEEPGAYGGTRFDWSGFISQVTLERGGYTFCVPESLSPGAGTGGAGLCNEFGISRAIGYEEAKVGEWFPKPGVGLLQKTAAGPYSFSGEYPLIPFTFNMQRNESAVTYTVEPLECRGYSMRLTKVIELKLDRLNISYTLENSGEKPIITEEYVHNFLGIGSAPVGSDYRLNLPGKPRIEETESSYTAELLEYTGSALTWKRQPERPFYCKLGFRAGAPADYYWELLHLPSGTGVRESGDYTPQRMALWGERHVISPEVFADIFIEPGMTGSWRRSFQFFGPKESHLICE
ncbi:hypothetical protein [Paenibacillus tepidiphilus]|uniref:hypothetical protein n=1 Tax=Paenibacillus tepidiphilus TaxID=2608683 RepID=UPI00123C4A51|nr:hypothetical protein [Paenibacillus tepidiphilus]